MYWRLVQFVILSVLLVRVAISGSVPGDGDNSSIDKERSLPERGAFS